MTKSTASAVADKATAVTAPAMHKVAEVTEPVRQKTVEAAAPAFHKMVDVTAPARQKASDLTGRLVENTGETVSSVKGAASQRPSVVGALGAAFVAAAGAVLAVVLLRRRA